MYKQLFENKFIQIYLITTNNTSESVFGKMYEQLPPLMEFVKSANGVRPSLFCIGSIMNNLFLITDDRNTHELDENARFASLANTS